MNSEIRILEMRVKLGRGDEELDLAQSAALRDLMNAHESQIATLTAERDEAEGKIHSARIFIDALSKYINCGATLENSGSWHSYLQTVANNFNLRMQEACDLRDRHVAERNKAQNEAESLKAELAALRSAPSMAEVDTAVEVVYEGIMAYAVDGDCENELGQLADIARRAIALHAFGKRRVDKVEELIRWMVKHWDWIGKLEGIAEGCVVEPWRDNARHILEIVEGK